MAEMTGDILFQFLIGRVKIVKYPIGSVVSYSVSIPYRQSKNREINKEPTAEMNMFQFLIGRVKIVIVSIQGGTGGKVSIPYRQSKNLCFNGGGQKMNLGFNSLQVE